MIKAQFAATPRGNLVSSWRECAPDSRISGGRLGKRPGRRLGGKECGVFAGRVSAKGRNPFFTTWAFAGSGRWNCVLWHCREGVCTKFQDFGRGRAEKPRSSQRQKRKWCTGPAQAAHRHAKSKEKGPTLGAKGPKRHSKQPKTSGRRCGRPRARWRSWSWRRGVR